MARTLDVSRHQALWHNQEAVTLQRLNEDGNVVATTLVPEALREAATTSILVGDRIIAASDATFWHLPQAVLGATAPAEKSYAILDSAGVRWIVWEGELATWKTRWRLTCTKE